MAVNEDLIFPFGKHKGRRLKDIPISYLDWVLSIAQQPLKGQVEAFLKTQAEYDQFEPTTKDEGEDVCPKCAESPCICERK